MVALTLLSKFIHLQQHTSVLLENTFSSFSTHNKYREGEHRRNMFFCILRVDSEVRQG